MNQNERPLKRIADYTDPAMASRALMSAEELASTGRQRCIETARGQRRETCLERTGVPTVFDRVRLQDMSVNDRRTRIAVNMAKAMVTRNDPTLAALVGRTGSGKTRLGASICNEFAFRGRAAKLSTFAGLYEGYKAAMVEGGTKPISYITDLVNQRFLCIDEIGRYRMDDKTAGRYEFLFEILNRRYDNRRATVLISNLTREEFSQYVGDAIVSRIEDDRRGNGAILTMDGPER